MPSPRNQSSQRTSVKQYAPLTPTLMWQLAAPHTWAATIAAVLFSFTYAACAYSGTMNIVLTLVLFIVCALMQSAANVFNDYFDYIKGTDTLENSSHDAFDAVLVYNHVNPRTVLFYGIALLLVALASGIYIIVVTSWIPLVIGIIGALVVLLYSAGKTPISYLPFGEIIVGFVMGGLIPLACCYVLSGALDFFVLVAALPIMIGIGLILATNNTCDIEKDSSTTRKTCAMVLGREKAVRVYRIAVIVWIVLIGVLTTCLFTPGLLFFAIMLVALYPNYRALFHNPLNAQTRDKTMPIITGLNISMTAFYCLAIMSSLIITWI